MRLDFTNLIKPTPNVIHHVFPFVTILRERQLQVFQSWGKQILQRACSLLGLLMAHH